MESKKMTSQSSKGVNGKKLILVGIVLFLTLQGFALGQNPCPCPNFRLVQDFKICPDPSCAREGDLITIPAACKNTAHTYYVYPNDPFTYTYTWTIAGATDPDFLDNPITGNPITIVWGSGSSGFIKVIIESGGCADTLTREVCLVDAPEADFSFNPNSPNPNSPCFGTQVEFSNNSNGASEYLWDFGDGNTSTEVNPSHTYTLSNTYDVLLTVYADCRDTLLKSDTTENCMCCRDTITKQITVQDAEGPDIYSADCSIDDCGPSECGLGTLCPGDTSSFCTDADCDNYVWGVTGGTIIISSQKTKSIKVKWDAPSTEQPTTVSLSCPGSACSSPTILNVPVLYPDFPIDGPDILCQNSSGTFSLPSMPGTYYSWTVTGGGYSFADYDSNTADVNITFYSSGTYDITCGYNNPLAGCEGESKTTVEVKPVFDIWGTDKVCEGGSGSYHANAPANWSISGPDASFSGSYSSTYSVSITFNIAGYYTITAVPISLSSFCNASSEFYVEVIAPPVLDDPIEGEVVICPGKNYVYSISSNTEGYPFVWTVTGGIPSEMGAYNDSVIVHWNASPYSGHYKISVSQTIGGPGCSSEKTMSIEPFAPPGISGPTDVCVDAISNYSATTSNGNPPSYQWSIAQPAHGTIISGQGESSVTIRWHGMLSSSSPPTLTVSTCGGDMTIPITVTHVPNVVISPDKIPYFCFGSTDVLTLTAIPSTGYSYVWYKEDNTPQQVGTGSTYGVNISTLAVGTHSYYVEITDNGCTKQSNTIKVVITSCVNGHPAPGQDCYAFFEVDFNCNGGATISNIQPGGASSYVWTVTPPASFPNGSPTITLSVNTDPGLTITESGTYTITLEPDNCGSYSEIISVLLPDASIEEPSSACEGEPSTFTASPSGSGYQYEWDFGDFGDHAFSYINPTYHAYTSPGTHIATLTVTDEFGCTDETNKTITVNPKPTCDISAAPTEICPGETATLTACSGMDSYQWYRNGAAISAATGSTYGATTHGEYWVSVTNNYGCTAVSDSIYISLKKIPVADITGDDNICVPGYSGAEFYLQTPWKSNYTYAWSCPWSSVTGGALGVSFTPGNGNGTNVTVDVSSIPNTFLIVVEVTDNNTGCSASDSICVNVNNVPVITGFNEYCYDGDNHIFSASVTPGNSYEYLWNTGETGFSISPSEPGEYTVTVIDPETGCSETQVMGYIFNKPDLSLYPRGCDTVCVDSTYDLYIPLPLKPWHSYQSSYQSIEWLDNGTPVSPQPTPWYSGTFPFSSSSTGDHVISVVVVDNNGCADTSEIFCLYVEECGEDTCQSCCDDFEIEVNSSVKNAGSTWWGWYVKATLTTGPNDITEIKADLVNFYVNNQPGCERCVDQNISLGSIVPCTDPQTQIDWNHGSSPANLISPTTTCSNPWNANSSPRELVWNNIDNGLYKPRPPLSGEGVTIRLVFPPPHIFQNTCCFDTIRFCIRWSFTDVECITCDTLICYEFAQRYKPGVDSMIPVTPPLRNYEIDPSLKIVPGQSALPPGESSVAATTNSQPVAAIPKRRPCPCGK